jgi:cyclopropane fatty-acyl-phospholipid synthase-like methyltransferase
MLLAGAVAIASCVVAQDPGAAPTTPPASAPETPIPPAPGTYMGRRIATTMHYTGAPWLRRGSREREEGTALMLANLGVRTGMTVCDLGCGNGYYSIPLARRTGDAGRVLAVDIQPEMLDMLRAEAEKAGVANVEPILGTVVDPRLPDGVVDLVLLVDVYHEMSHPEQMLAAIRRALAPKGRVVLVEFRAEDPKVPIKPLHKMSRTQILAELEANGFALVDEFDGLPWQHMMSFGVAPTP